MTTTNLTQNQLKDLWKKYMNNESYDCRSMRKLILASWERCKENEVNHLPHKIPLLYDEEQLVKHKSKLHELLDISLPIMENLYKFVADAGFLVVLCDAQGCILELIGSEEIKEAGKPGNFIPGAVWSEAASGTNSIGTSLYLGRPIQVRGREHYCLMFHHWCCSAAPIHDAEGKIIGALDISGPLDKVHTHTLGMIVTAVSAIETQLKLRNALYLIESANNYKNAVMESISEGLMAIDNNCRVTHINRIMASYLDINQDDMGKQFYEIISENNKELYDIIVNNTFVTDYEINIDTREGKHTYLVTSRPINGEENCEGTVLLFSEITRVRRLVQRMSGSEGTLTFSDLIGKDETFLETVDLALKSAGSNSNVLLLGESGTGKDLFAQAIHNASIRKNGPFVAINCGAIPRELIASELFGYTDGAFTGAKRGGKLGKFEIAHNGTIFLDEIGEMPLELQTTLLRVLEARTITRLGGHDNIPIDARIIAATNKDLNTEVNQGKFRQDLYYRLNVFTIKVVPLRERKDDIPLLVEHFIESLCLKLKKQPIKKVDKKVWEVFNNYHWPGNVRELQNVLERVVNVCNEPVLRFEHLPKEIILMSKSRCLDLPVRSYERELICNLLELHNRNISRVAAEMGIARTTLYHKIAKYNI